MNNTVVKETSPKELKARLDKKDPIDLIDVREDHERALCHIGGKHIPMGQITQRVNEIDRNKEVVIYCRSGGRSKKVIEALQQDFKFTNLINLNGGILRWSDEVDSSITKY